MLFGVAAGLLIVPVVRKLKAHGLLAGDDMKAGVSAVK